MFDEFIEDDERITSWQIQWIDSLIRNCTLPEILIDQFEHNFVNYTYSEAMELIYYLKDNQKGVLQGNYNQTDLNKHFDKLGLPNAKKGL